MSSKPSSLLAPTHWAIVSAVSLVLLLILMIINVDHGIVRALMVIFGAVSTFSFFEFRAASRAESQADLMEQVTLAISKAPVAAPVEQAEAPSKPKKQQRIDLSAANIDGAVLTGIDFDGATLERLAGKEVDLRQSSMVDVNLSQASLPHAKLDESNLQRARLNEASLPHASLMLVNLEQAKLDRAA